MGTLEGVTTPQDTDAELLAAHVAGDPIAFEQLFRRHHRRLYRLARATSRTPEDAADALQEAMLSAHRGAATFRNEAAVTSWLYRIVVNACLDRLRRTKPYAPIELDEETYTLEDPSTDVDTSIVVEKALLRLPPEQRAAVIAVDMQGYSVADAAQLLGVPEGTVKSRCARARARLAVALHYLDAAASVEPETIDY